jgi:predicted RNA binding protein YcfA (HicA-like mRNA interferase family)
MTKREKLISRIRNNPKDVSLRDIRVLLEAFGFELIRIRGSHHIFVGMVSGEEITLAIPSRHPVKVVYVKRVIEIIDEVVKGEAGNGTD